MLVLARKRNESLVVSPDGGETMVNIVVLEIRGDKVRLGIEAPKEWLIHRQEVWAAIKRTEGSSDENGN